MNKLHSIGRRVVGEIKSSLYLALKEQNISDLLALKLAEVYAWQIDFYKIYKGKYYYLKENIDEEMWELHKVDIVLN